MWPAPVTLSGTYASLVSLVQSHAGDFAEAATGLQGLWYTMIPTSEGLPAEITRRHGLQDAGSMLPFAMLDTADRAVGMTT